MTGALHVDTGEPFGLDAEASFFEYFARDAIGWRFGEFQQPTGRDPLPIVTSFGLSGHGRRGQNDPGGANGVTR